ncbi:MAG TPA: helix-turn-helix transcriptional regulator, partial [bacterium]|nr:helix-turn-helix transcriptional regulator [bacterium]
VTADPPGATYGPRLSQNYELIWIREGEVKATFGQALVLGKEGTFLFRRPGVRDHYEWSKRGRTVHAYVQFKVPRGGFALPEKGVPASRPMPDNDVLRPLFNYLLQLDALKEPQRTGLMVPTLELMLRSYISGQVGVKPQLALKMPELVGRSVEMIARRIAQAPAKRLSLTELSKEAHTSPENLCRLFQKSLRLGPLEYAKLVRLDMAAHRLGRTHQSVKEVAAATGFYDAFHLSNSFKKVYGLSPKDFKASPLNEWITQKNPIVQTLYSGPYHPPHP